MNWHAEVLSEEQHAVLGQLGHVAADLGYYLGGGTAVALHLGHRRSVDFDWFTGVSLDNPLQLARTIQDRGVGLQVSTVERGTLHGIVAAVRVSFLEMRYPPLKPPVDWPSFRCAIASQEDLAALKLLAVAQRGSKKDFLDVYALGLQGLSVGQMLAWYCQKFSVADVSRVLYSLCYFDDADREPMPKMLAIVTWDQVKETIRDWVKSTAG
jgi:hypothetical protein